MPRVAEECGLAGAWFAVENCEHLFSLSLYTVMLFVDSLRLEGSFARAACAVPGLFLSCRARR